MINVQSFGTFFGGTALFLRVVAQALFGSRDPTEFPQSNPTINLNVNAQGLLGERSSGEFPEGLGILSMSVSAVGSVT